MRNASGLCLSCPGKPPKNDCASNDPSPRDRNCNPSGSFSPSTCVISPRNSPIKAKSLSPLGGSVKAGPFALFSAIKVEVQANARKTVVSRYRMSAKVTNKRIQGGKDVFHTVVQRMSNATGRGDGIQNRGFVRRKICYVPFDHRQIYPLSWRGGPTAQHSTFPPKPHSQVPTRCSD